MSQTVDRHQAALSPVPRRRVQGHRSKNKQDAFEERTAQEQDRRDLPVDHHPGIPGTQLQARGADRQPGQGLPAAGRRAVRAGLREDPALCARFAGLRRLLPHLLQPSLQGADRLRVRFHDRRRGGVRRPEEHVRRSGKRQGPVQAGHDRGLHHLHGGGHRRRPQRLHQQHQEGRAHPAGLPGPLRPYPELRRLAIPPAGTTCSRASSATSP